MKPPVCEICGKALKEKEGGLVYFQKTEADRLWDVEMEEFHMKGDPPYAGWFCKKHYEDACALSNFHFDDAVAKIKKSEK